MMTNDVKLAVYNPFRTPTVTPNPTGASAGPSTSTTSSRPPPPSRPMTPPTRSSRESIPSRQERLTDDLATDLQATTLEDNEPSEPPPAYTPSANPYQGEATVEYGPHRPFQPAPPPPPLPQQFTGVSQGGYFMSPQPTGMPMVPNPTGGWGQYPGQGMPSSSSLGYFGPPPRHPSMSGIGPGPAPQTNLIPTPTGTSDFARDFYASAPSNRRPSPVPSEGSSGETADPEHFERVQPAVRTPSSIVPPSGPPLSRYEPPNGPPPPSSPSSPYPPPSEPPLPRPSRVASSNTDDWKPTTTPTPGRPLLNKGRVLVYPSGFECKKCLNTGYKSFDPSHPCRRCWEKYSKPYSGAILYAPRSQQSQRPLPSLRPPHLRHQQSQSQSQSQSQRSLLQPPPSNLSRSQSAYRPSSSPCQGYLGRAVSNPNPGLGLGPGGFVLPQQPLAMPTPQLSFTRGRPPPGSMVVQPGDPRIGGRPCWRCDGSGTVSFLIFDVEQCPICKGLGRTFQ